MQIICCRATSAHDLSAGLEIREAVFIVEQNVPAALERDGHDNDCLHYLITVDGIAMGTARVMVLNDKFKFQRVAILPVARGIGLGATLMRFMMDDLAARNDAAGKSVFLSSQVSAIGFYEHLSFEICSDAYMDAGIEHKDMVRPITAQ
ncbi:MAG: GNAT family N-acetyltransferase [Ahrensia sp.]|nr:GNAT family N-acetyltransferase [Ahrensia sp.]